MTGAKEKKKKEPQGIQKASYGLGELSLEHYFLVLLHRKWLVLATFLVVSAGTAVYTKSLPNIYTSETVVLVNPQQVPERFVAATVTGDVRSRLGAISQQILSATRLQKIIERFNLYSEQRKQLPHEVIINLMRQDISVQVLSDLQGFKIAYSGEEPRVVAQVTNELASLFIEENLKARERMVTGTAEFIENQLDQTRKELETQETQIRDFKLKHLGEMPEQQQANLQILGTLQAQLQAGSDSLSRAEQQRSYLRAFLESQSIPSTQNVEKNTAEKNADPVQKPLGPSPEELQLAALLSRYGEKHPDVQHFKRQINEQRQTRERAEPQTAQAAKVIATTGPEVIATPPLANPSNSATQAQINAIEGEIAQRKKDHQRLTESIAAYQAKVESVPVREQEITDLVRDYGISKEYYSQLLTKKLTAETGTQLEIRQKGEQFTILDPARVPEKPSRPNRLRLLASGSVGGLGLGLALALATEFLGITIISPEQIVSATGLVVLGVIPILRTRADRRRRRWAVASAVTGAVMLLLAGAFLLYHFQDTIF